MARFEPEPLTDTVETLVSSHPGYARILNPARGIDGRVIRWRQFAPREPQIDSRWAEFASEATRLGINGPLVGTLDPSVITGLIAALGEESGSDAPCYFLQWEGYADSPRPDVAALTVEVGYERRRMWVLEGTLRDLQHDSSIELETRVPLWWLEANGSWTIASDIYARSVYVGGSEALIRRLLLDESLEVIEARSNDSVVGEEFD